jgi:sterol 3beta-glucosyltransferase
MMIGEPEPAMLAGLLIEAVGQAGCRAIIQADWERLRDVEVPDTVYRLTRAPHSVLMPRCAAAVHHGGAGTTHAAALAGIPSAVVAFIADQLFWAERLRQAGIGAKPLRRVDLTAKKLARELRWLLDTPGAARRAEEVGRLLREEDGVARAVELVAAAMNAR